MNYVAKKVSEINPKDLGKKFIVLWQDDILERICLGVTVNMVSSGSIGLIFGDEGYEMQTIDDDRVAYTSFIAEVPENSLVVIID